MPDEPEITPDPGDLAILSDETSPPNNDDDKEPEVLDDKGEIPPETDIPEEKEEDTPEEDTDDADEEDKEEVEEKVEGTEEKSPAWAKVREKYPKFFKEFPEVASALGRELEYKKIFPTLDAAKESKERLDFHTELEEDIMKGSSASLLTNLHKTDEKVLEKFATNFLPTLMRGNPPLYEKVTVPILKNFLRFAKIEGEKHGVKDLVEATRWLSNFAFNSTEIPEDEKPKEDKDKEPSEESKQLRQLMQTKVSDFKTELQESTQNVLENIVKSGVDPKGPDGKSIIPQVVRKGLLRDILGEVADTLGKDTEHTATMNKLWKEAQKDSFSRQHLSQLKTAYLARAKKILPAIQKKHFEEALRELGRPITKEVPKDSKTRKIGPKKEETKKYAPGFHSDPKKINPNLSDEELLK